MLMQSRAISRNEKFVLNWLVLLIQKICLQISHSARDTRLETRDYVIMYQFK